MTVSATPAGEKLFYQVRRRLQHFPRRPVEFPGWPGNWLKVRGGKRCGAKEGRLVRQHLQLAGREFQWAPIDAQRPRRPGQVHQ